MTDRKASCRGQSGVAEKETTWARTLGSALAFFIPFWAGLSRVSPVVGWQNDGQLVRVLTGVVPPQGAVSNLLAQAALVIPLGTCAQRASCVSAAALGVVGYAVFCLSWRMLSASKTAGGGQVAVSWFALLAALTTTLCTSAQRPGAILAGGSVSAALAWLVIAIEVPSSAQVGPCVLRLGATLGALTAEDAWVSAITIIVLCVRGAALGSFPARRSVLAGLAIGATAAALLLAPAGIRALGPSASPLVADSNLRISALKVGALGLFRTFSTEFGGLGSLALMLALVGVGAGLARRRHRAQMAPLATLVFFDFAATLIFSESSGAVTFRSALRLLALGSLAIPLALAFQEASAKVQSWNVRTWRSAVVFLGMFDAALVATRAEQSAFALTESEGADRFIDDGLERLPSSAVVIVRSEALYTRLLGSQLLTATRPDVALVPYPQISTSQATSSLLRDRPYIADIVRDLSVYGHPLERSLSALADVHPTFVELDPAWDRRIVSHLVPEHLWFRFTPEPRGAVERRTATSRMADRIRALVSPDTQAPITDAVTVSQLIGRLRECAALALALGDRDHNPDLAAEIERLSTSMRLPQ